jgi:hypothetical protein
MFALIDRRLWEYGLLEINKRMAGRPRTIQTPDLEEAVLDTIEEKPSSRKEVRNMFPVRLYSSCHMDVIVP